MRMRNQQWKLTSRSTIERIAYAELSDKDGNRLALMRVHPPKMTDDITDVKLTIDIDLDSADAEV